MLARSVRREFFDRVCRGEPVGPIALSLGMSVNTGYRWWQHAGLVKLQQGKIGSIGVTISDGPGGRGHRLNLDERTAIMRGLDLGLSCAEIARSLGRDRSVVWREVHRNRAGDGDYHALMAQTSATVKAKRPKAFKLVAHPAAGQITEWMDQGWSPRLIAVMLKLTYPDDTLMWVSHETIYQALYVQTRGNLRADLYRTLSTGRHRRKSRISDTRRGSAATYREAFTIAERPPEADDRAVPGHWEGDLIIGSGGSAIGTLVERSTRFVILLHLGADHRAETVATAMIAAMGDLPAHLRRSITWDRGTELADYRKIQLKLAAPVFFCDPHSPWQRGSNENTNRLLRFWFAKGSDLRAHSAADVAKVADTLNKRPRPTLDLDTPANRLAQLLAEAAA